MACFRFATKDGLIFFDALEILHRHAFSLIIRT